MNPKKNAPRGEGPSEAQGGRSTTNSSNNTTLAALCAEALTVLQAAGLPFETLEPDTGFRRHPSREHSRLWYIANSGTGRSGRPYLQVSAGDPRVTGEVDTATFTWSSWKDCPGVGMDAAELAEVRRDIEAKTKEAKARRASEREQGRAKAACDWAEATEAGAERHPYLQTKRVGAYALRVAGDLLLVPVRDVAGEIHALQTIGADGTKRFTKAGAIGGHFHLIGEPSAGKPLYLAEGYATAATIHAATGAAVAVAFNCGNLLPVAKVLRATYPGAALIVAGDNDAWTAGNPGLAHAKEAAEAVGAAVVLPHFNGFDLMDRPTDFNDLARLGGLEAVRAQLGPPATAAEILTDAIVARSAGDVGACSTPAAEAAWRAIHTSDKAEFLRLREKAKAAGARVAEIDAAARWKAPKMLTTPRHVEGWKADLITISRANDIQIIPCRVHNLILILRHAEQFAGRLRWNSFSAAVEIDGAEMSDLSITCIRAELEKSWIGGDVKRESLEAAIGAVAHDHEFHPVVAYLDSLSWDRTPRVRDFFPRFCGSPSEPYFQDAAISLFVSAVLRARNPGCQVDTMTILCGPQGIGKTALWRTIFSPWSSEVTDSLDNKDFFSGLRGTWCADFGELDQFTKAEVSRIKQIITIREDHYRAHYGRVHAMYPRQGIFVGGTNAQEFLRDPTGGRRFLPIQTRGQINVEAVGAVRDQLWAEADILSRTSAQWWVVRGADAQQEAVYEVDSWEDVVAEWLVGRAKATTSDVLSNALHLEIGKHARWEQIRVGHILRRLGWERRRERGVDGLRWVYHKAVPI